MALIPKLISQLNSGTVSSASYIVFDLGGVHYKCTVADLLALVATPTNMMAKSVYDADNDGVVDNAEKLNNQDPSYYLNRANHTGTIAMSDVVGLVAALTNVQYTTGKNVPNGYAGLDSSGKIPASLLPVFGITPIENYNATTNTPAISDATGALGDWYIVDVAGVQNLGSGAITMSVGGHLIHNGTKFLYNDPGGAVASVNGQTGVVVLTADNIAETGTRKYVSSAQKDALNAASSPSAVNPLITQSVLSALTTASVAPSTNRNYVTDNEDAAMANSQSPSAGNPFMTQSAVAALIPTVSVTGKFWVSPEDYGAVHSPQTFQQAGLNQAYIDANYPGVGAVPTDTRDWAAMQMAFNASGTLGNVYAPRNYVYHLNKGVQVPVTQGRRKADFQWARLTSTNNNTWSFLYTPMPVDNSAALVRIVDYNWEVENLRIDGGSNQTGIAFQAMYMPRLKNIHGKYLKWIVDWRFCLKGMIDAVEGGDIVNGISLGCGTSREYAGDPGAIAYWAGADPSNSQSNMTTITNAHLYFGVGSTGTGIKVWGSSGCRVRDSILEGHACGIGIDFHAQSSPNVFDFEVENTHFEVVGGASTAFIKARTTGGYVNILQPYGQHASILADVAPYNGSYGNGYVRCRVEDMHYWVPSGGKVFRNHNATWDFHYIDQMIPYASTTSYFTGTAVSEFSGYAGGPNKWRHFVRMPL